MEIAIPLTKDANKREKLEGSFTRALSRARSIDAQESGSRENRELIRLLQNSPLIRSRGYGSHHDPTKYILP